MAERYIGINDRTTNDAKTYTYTGKYEDTLEDCLMKLIRSRGGLLAMMEPCTDEQFTGFKQVLITVGCEDESEDEQGSE